MTKYHVNINGNAGLCKASKGTCPFGDAEEHFATKHDAEAAYEKQMAGNTFNPIKMTYEERKEKLLQAFQADFPHLKIITRGQNTEAMQGPGGLGLRKNQEVLFKVQAQGKYDAVYSVGSQYFEKWAENNNMKVIFNANVLAPAPAKPFAHFVINKPKPSNDERIKQKIEQIEKLQKEIEALKKEK